MPWEAWTTLAVTLLLLVAMARNVAGPDLVLVGGLTLLLALGIVDPAHALAGFANPAVITVAALFVVAAGLRETGGLDYLARRVLGRPRSLLGAQVRMMAPVVTMSAFLNNTPVVAMMVPIVIDWARRTGRAASRLLIPLSYAAILGGMCTLIGTSTNLVVAGMALGRDPSFHFGLFEVAWLGVPAAAVGILYILAASRWLLPDTREAARALDNPREYTVAMRVEPDSVVVQQSIEEAGLRHLPGLYLVEIERGGQVLAAPGPRERLRAGDTLLFAGIIDSVVDLRRIRGLSPATDQVRKLDPHPDRRMVEAVVAPGSSLVGQSVRETRFRTVYGAAIIAVHRQGERVRSKVGDITLRAGDTLLLESHPRFLRERRHDGDFALVSEVEGGAPRRHDKAWIATAILVLMVVLNVSGILSLLVAALLAAAAMIATRCVTGTEARRALELHVLVAIAAAFGIGAALDASGAAHVLGAALVHFALPFGRVGVLAAIYLATAATTAAVTNNAAAALMFPVTAAAATASGLPLRPCLLVLMVAASASFATPVGYQTNLMVYGPGGYRFIDFVRFGLPLQLLVGLVVVTTATLLWL